MEILIIVASCVTTDFFLSMLSRLFFIIATVCPHYNKPKRENLGLEIEESITTGIY